MEVVRLLWDCPLDMTAVEMEEKPWHMEGMVAWRVTSSSMPAMSSFKTAPASGSIAAAMEETRLPLEVEVAFVTNVMTVEMAEALLHGPERASPAVHLRSMLPS